MSGIKASADSGKISLNKTAKTLQETAKINVLDKQTGQVRDMMSILDELAEKWHSVGEDALTKNQKSGIAEAISGKNHINTFMAIMDNWNQVKILNCRLSSTTIEELRLLTERKSGRLSLF
ncbi:hypothetical protein [Clostridioides difficile]|uniref:hypothetical protein n=1 Tax=Clostridioides difficile TaxID=1496 RepID=UPI0020C27808|nr:hypothetical protein [Clostridioides difficile]MCP8339002.1 hypothetical protein [Clostridioides difficile]MCP8368568.1 hypothetical protein [Clostridioides difficile]MCP8386678.1 hypothetical protein [Clostridioides difficile]HCQ5967441.1 hypothetical protein [Clostridioides difficile]